jgi:hypothetical protein
MRVATQDRCCAEAHCECVPGEFVRLRYYFGQRLGVVDLSDAQAYVMGKQRFHNLRAHGAGVLCGLRADRFVHPQDSPPGTATTVLRVRRGAALDGCGREVVVGADQCIDVAAWFARYRGRPVLAGWTSPGQHTLWVALRYLECPSDPAPAPRDPCGCDAGGCEFGRVREAFELALLTEEEQQTACRVFGFPPAESVRAALGGLALEERLAGATDQRLGQALRQLLGEPCPVGCAEGWLCLASFQATLTDVAGTLRVTDISKPDNAILERAALLSTSALQSLVADLTAAAADDGLVGTGPRLTGLTFEGSGTDAGTLRAPMELVREGTPPAETPLAAATFQATHVRVVQFTPALAWQNVTPAPTITYETGPVPPGPHIKVAFGAGSLAADRRYRVTFASPHEMPVVDQKMRPLRPARFARHFRLVASGGTLALAETLF